MKTKTKKERYAVYYRDLDEENSFYDYDESFDSYEDAEKYIEDNSRKMMGEDQTNDGSWGYIIFKEMKHVEYTSKAEIKRTLTSKEI
jgi:hypothetical protein